MGIFPRASHHLGVGLDTFALSLRHNPKAEKCVVFLSMKLWFCTNELWLNTWDIWSIFFFNHYVIKSYEATIEYYCDRLLLDLNIACRFPVTINSTVNLDIIYILENCYYLPLFSTTSRIIISVLVILLTKARCASKSISLRQYYGQLHLLHLKQSWLPQ